MIKKNFEFYMQRFDDDTMVSFVDPTGFLDIFCDLAFCSQFFTYEKGVFTVSVDPSMGLGADDIHDFRNCIGMLSKIFENGQAVPTNEVSGLPDVKA